MESIKSTPFSSFKSKKPLLSPAPSDQKTSKVSGSDPKTPGKPVDPPRRSQRRTAVMSINDIRQAAMKLREKRSDPTQGSEMPSRSTEPPVTPSKKKKKVDSEIKLPGKYELLQEFFNCLESSIRLLVLKGSSTNFTNISLQVQCLTERRFTHSHLAQLKFIMPEAIVLEKTLRYEESTCCMMPDLRVSLSLDSCEKVRQAESHTKYVQLRKVFRNRLLDYFKSRPEGDDVPEEALPEPFNRVKENVSVNSSQAAGSCSSTQSPGALPKQVVAASHMSPSFRKSFTQREPLNHTQNMMQQKSVASLPAISESEIASPCKEASSVDPKSSSCVASTLLETPVKCNVKDLSSIGTPTMLKTPAQTLFTPAKFMTATPTLNTPKRSYMSPDDKLSQPPSKLVKRQPVKKPLKFDTPVKKVNSDNELGTSGGLSPDDQLDDILSPALISSIREKEQKTLMEQDPAISQARHRLKMIACLPRLFDTVRLFFQSKNRSVVTKDELMHSVVSQNLRIVDKGEVEKQLTLLVELAPEWINIASSMSGDLIVRINKISDPEAIRTRLLEAK